MTKKGIISLCLSAAILVVLFLASSTDYIIKEKATPVYEVSVLVDKANDNGLENFKMGMDKVALKYNVDISFVTLYDEKEPFRQTQLLLREVADGTQGLIVSAENPAVMENMMKIVPKGLPVFVFGNTVESPRIKDNVAPEYIKMAEDIAKRMIKDQPDASKVTLVTSSKNKADIDIMSEAIQNICAEKGIEVSLVNLTSLDEADTLLSGLVAQGNNVMITPQLNVAEAVAKAAEKTRAQIPIYSVGWSSNIWRYLENGYITATVAYNAYDAGYFAIKSIVEQIEGSYKENSQYLSYAVVDANSLYTKEIQTMLFPIY